MTKKTLYEFTCDYVSQYNDQRSRFTTSTEATPLGWSYDNGRYYCAEHRLKCNHIVTGAPSQLGNRWDVWMRRIDVITPDPFHCPNCGEVIE